jgi:hypothetical protein
MRSIPGVPLTIAELQLSSPLPSPSRQSILNSNTQQYHNSSSSSSSSNTYNYNNTTTTLDPASISTSTKTMFLPRIQFDQSSPHHSSDLYPLANLATPLAMKKFKFSIDGMPSLFEEVSTAHVSLSVIISYFKVTNFFFLLQ